MANVKEFYKNYLASDEKVQLHYKLYDTILNMKPHYNILEFGCGTAKNIIHLYKFFNSIWEVRGIDISEKNIEAAKQKISERENIILTVGDENYLKEYRDDYFDVTFTCSVLDHIENIDEIISQMKRISTTGIVLAETNDTPGEFYYPHDYEKYGFTRISFMHKSEIDGAIYEIWTWKRES